MDYQKIRLNASQFRAITSLSVEEFDELFIEFDYEWESYIHCYTFDGKRRTRKYTPRDTEHLNTNQEKFFFILAYQKNASIQEFFAASFGLTQDMANKWIHVLSPLLEKTLKHYRPARRAEDIKLGSETEYILDATERPVERDCYEQEKYYSGKKRLHTIKNLILVSTIGTILFISPTVFGTVHDKKLADQTLSFQKPASVLADLGFIGYKDDNVTLTLPMKKPKNKELTKIQKKQNMLLSRRRVLVEHAIGHLKTMRIVKDTNRNRKFGFRDLVMQTAASLHNFRISKRRVRYLPESFNS